MPVLFVGHGSPMNIVLKNSYTEDITKAARETPKPRAILVISAHWLTNGTFVEHKNKSRKFNNSMLRLPRFFGAIWK